MDGLSRRGADLRSSAGENSRQGLLSPPAVSATFRWVALLMRTGTVAGTALFILAALTQASIALLVGLATATAWCALEARALPKRLARARETKGRDLQYDYACQDPVNKSDLDGNCIGPLAVVCVEIGIEGGGALVALFWCRRSDRGHRLRIVGCRVSRPRRPVLQHGSVQLGEAKGGKQNKRSKEFEGLSSENPDRLLREPRCPGRTSRRSAQSRRLEMCAIGGSVGSSDGAQSIPLED